MNSGVPTIRWETADYVRDNASSLIPGYSLIRPSRPAQEIGDSE